MLYNIQLSNLPENLEYLKLGSNFNHPIELPPKLIRLTIYNPNYSHFLNLPKSLKNLVIGHKIKYSESKGTIIEIID